MSIERVARWALVVIAVIGLAAGGAANLPAGPNSRRCAGRSPRSR